MLSKTRAMIPAAGAGFVYFVIVFAAGFVLGTLRILMVTPILGEAAAVLIELPIMLAISWFACAWLVRSYSVMPNVRDRALMGTVALVLLMTAELALSGLGFGRSPVAFALSLISLPGLLGLGGQLAFATFPLLECKLR